VWQERHHARTEPEKCETPKRGHLKVLGRGSRDAIVDAAQRLFLERFGAVSIDELAAAASLARRTLYNQFTSKEEIFREMLLRVSGQLEDAFPPGIETRGDRRGYLAALDDMFALTSTAMAPWHVVPAEYKWFARVALAKTVVKALGKGIALGPPAFDPEVIKAGGEFLSRKEIAALGLAEPGRAKD
jgi:AcrR family transcriptional regulator